MLTLDDTEEIPVNPIARAGNTPHALLRRAGQLLVAELTIVMSQAANTTTRVWH